MPQKFRSTQQNHQSANCKSFQSYFKNLDIFGYPITFTYKGDTHYKTSFGAWLTVLQVMCVMAFCANELYGVHQRNPSISISNYYLDLVGTPEIVYLSPQDFDMAFSISSISKNTTLNEEWDRYVSISIIESEQRYVMVDGQKVYEQPMKYMDLIKCPEGRFANYTSFTEAVGLTENYYCLADQNMMLQGSLNSESTITYYVNIAECNQTTLDYYQKNKTCASDPTEVYHMVQDLQVFSSFMSKQYNTYQFDDSKDPIEPYVYTHYSFINPDLSVMYQLSLKTKTAIGTNSYISNSISTYNYTFYETQMSTGWIGKPWGDFYPYVGFAINQNPEVIQVTRSNKNLLQAMSNTGGLAGVMTLIFRWITTKVNKKKFPIDAANQIYTSYQRRHLGLISERRSQNPIDIETSMISQISFKKGGQLDQMPTDPNAPVPVNFSFKEYLILKLKSFFRVGMNTHGFKHRLGIYQRGLTAFHHNIDTVKLIRMQRQLKWMLRNILSDNQLQQIRGYERKFLGVKLASDKTLPDEELYQSSRKINSNTLDISRNEQSVNQQSSSVFETKKQKEKKKKVMSNQSNQRGGVSKNTTMLDLTLDNFNLQNSSSRQLRNENVFQNHTNDFLGVTKDNFFSTPQTFADFVKLKGNSDKHLDDKIQVIKEKHMKKKKKLVVKKKKKEPVTKVIKNNESDDDQNCVEE